MRALRFSSALKPPAGPSAQQIVLNGVRIPLAVFDVDLTNLTRIELRFGTATPRGSIQFSELALQQPR